MPALAAYIGMQYGRYLEWQNIQSEIDVEC